MFDNEICNHIALAWNIFASHPKETFQKFIHNLFIYSLCCRTLVSHNILCIRKVPNLFRIDMKGIMKAIEKNIQTQGKLPTLNFLARLLMQITLSMKENSFVERKVSDSNTPALLHLFQHTVHTYTAVYD